MRQRCIVSKSVIVLSPCALQGLQCCLAVYLVRCTRSDGWLAIFEHLACGQAVCQCWSAVQDADDWWDGIEEDADPGSGGREDAADDGSDGGDALALSDEGEEPADDERYRDMLAAATGRLRDADARQRRRRSDVLVSEAYPESEYNVSAQAATAGATRYQMLRIEWALCKAQLLRRASDALQETVCQW